jgi:hypothetical protein
MRMAINEGFPLGKTPPLNAAHHTKMMAALRVMF